MCHCISWCARIKISLLLHKHLFTEEPFVNIRFETNDTELEVKAGLSIFYIEASYQSYPDANISWSKDEEPIVDEYSRFQIRYYKVWPTQFVCTQMFHCMGTEIQYKMLCDWVYAVLYCLTYNTTMSCVCRMFGHQYEMKLHLKMRE